MMHAKDDNKSKSCTQHVEIKKIQQLNSKDKIKKNYIDYLIFFD